MSFMKLACRLVGMVALSWAAGDSLECFGQLPPPQTYSNYYNQELDQLGRPMTNTAAYTFNKMYYHNPAISPYSSLLRSPGYGGTAYSQYVQPEEQRRANVEAKNLERRSPGNTGNAALGRPAVPSSGAYQNHWYGSRQQMGL